MSYQCIFGLVVALLIQAVAVFVMDNVLEPEVHPVMKVTVMHSWRTCHMMLFDASVESS